MMHDGATGPAVNLDAVVPGPHAVGLGALSELRGEVTILDDRVWYSYPDGAAKIKTLVGPARGESAALLVVADVESWESIRIEEALDMAGLEQRLTQIATERFDGQAFPFLVEAVFPSLQIHIIDGERVESGASHEQHRKAAVTLAPEKVPATLVGFYSDSHQGVFTHHSQRTHIHAVIDEPLATGHVDGVELPVGAILKVPK
jgi:alpha-acetolactate decarboxylase